MGVIDVESSDGVGDGQGNEYSPAKELAVTPLSEQIQLGQEILAGELLRRDAVRINLDAPFKLTSGNYSPIYINCRQLISYRSSVHLVVAIATLAIESLGCQFDVVAGGETAGIPFASFVASAWNVPLVYVRKAAKTHGSEAQIEGVVWAHSRVLLIEDLITDGASKIGFIDAIRRHGGVISDTVAVLDRLQGGAALLAEREVRLTSLTNIQTVLRVAIEWSVWSRDVVDSLHLYLASPRDWHAQRNLPYVAAGE